MTIPLLSVELSIAAYSRSISPPLRSGIFSEWPYPNEFRIVGVVDQNAADALLPEFAEQAGGIDIGDAIEDGTEQIAEARIGGHHFKP
jgi:hypothetical protein